MGHISGLDMCCGQAFVSFVDKFVQSLIMRQENNCNDSFED